MIELRRSKRVLDQLEIRMKASWLPSVMNRYADGLSRRSLRRDAQILPRLRRSVANGLRAPRDAFPYRPLGEHPSIKRRLLLEDLQWDWNHEETLILCPPPDLIPAVLRKPNKTRAPEVPMIPVWPRQPWYAAAVRLAYQVVQMEGTGTAIWTSRHRLNSEW